MIYFRKIDSNMTLQKIKSFEGNPTEQDKCIRHSPDWILNVIISEQGGTLLTAKATAEKEARNKDFTAANTIAGALAGLITSLIINIYFKK